MRFRTTLILFVLALAIGLFIKFYESKRPNTQEANRRAQNVINFERDKIDGIVIQNADERIELKRSDKKWRLESPVKDLADGSVELQVMGDADEVESFIKEIAEESAVAHHIDKLSAVKIPPLENCSGFRIAH